MEIDMLRRFIVLFVISLLMVSCRSIPKDVSPVAATWLYGVHALPASATVSGSTESFVPTYKNTLGADSAGKKLKPGVKVPIAIHLHGCAGMTTGNQHAEYQDLLLSQGYAVFMPDSFARPERENLCGQGGLSDRIDTRIAEVRYALKQIRTLPWVDQKRMVLTGFSEGGNTVDNWPTDDFAGLVVLGSACTKSGGSPIAPDNVPVLAIVGELDDYRPGLSCSIKRTVGGSKSIVIPGADHYIALYTETQTAIKLFLKQCCK